eukprot:TRINITY_DN2274_c0_g1_i1.p1 TRINITY_DN2274_c0_g1~~TRINITY_DN2274_c0_g1_i1.p1  ORF type:complete len:636 (-),score=169.91 TRINITY_DN2274_c0_g1_i1:63-1934(-)
MGGTKSKKKTKKEVSPSILSFFSSTKSNIEPKEEKIENTIILENEPDENTWFQQQIKPTFTKDTILHEPELIAKEKQDLIFDNIFSRANLPIKDLTSEFCTEIKENKISNQILFVNKKIYRVNDNLAYFKFFQFHENTRPPFWGTNTFESSVVTPLNPLLQEPLLDYDNDSGVEYIPTNLSGEADVDGPVSSDSEDEDADSVDDEFVVADGYLSDEEADGENINLSEKTSSKKIPVVSRMPICVVPQIKGSNSSARVENLIDQYPELYEEPEELPFKHNENRTNEPNRKEFIDEFKNYQVNAPKWGKLAMSLMHLPFFVVQDYDPVNSVTIEEVESFQKRKKPSSPRSPQNSMEILGPSPMSPMSPMSPISPQSPQSPKSPKEKIIIKAEDLFSYELDLFIEYIHGKEGSKHKIIRDYCTYLAELSKNSEATVNIDNPRRIPSLTQTMAKDIFTDHVIKVGRQFFCDEHMLKLGHKEHLMELIPKKEDGPPVRTVGLRKRKGKAKGNVPIASTKTDLSNSGSNSGENNDTCEVQESINEEEDDGKVSPVDDSSITHEHQVKFDRPQFVEEDMKKDPKMEETMLNEKEDIGDIYNLTDTQLYGTQLSPNEDMEEPHTFMMSQAF